MTNALLDFIAGKDTKKRKYVNTMSQSQGRTVHDHIPCIQHKQDTTKTGQHMKITGYAQCNQTQM